MLKTNKKAFDFMSPEAIGIISAVILILLFLFALKSKMPLP